MSYNLPKDGNHKNVDVNEKQFFCKKKVSGQIRLTKNSGDLKSGLLVLINGQKEVGLQMVQISNGI